MYHSNVRHRMYSNVRNRTSDKPSSIGYRWFCFLGHSDNFHQGFPASVCALENNFVRYVSSCLCYSSLTVCISDLLFLLQEYMAPHLFGVPEGDGVVAGVDVAGLVLEPVPEAVEAAVARSRTVALPLRPPHTAATATGAAAPAEQNSCWTGGGSQRTHSSKKDSYH
jgi:hypothetical protein